MFPIGHSPRGAAYLAREVDQAAGFRDRVADGPERPLDEAEQRRRRVGDPGAGAVNEHIVRPAQHE